MFFRYEIKKCFLAFLCCCIVNSISHDLNVQLKRKNYLLSANPSIDLRTLQSIKNINKLRLNYYYDQSGKWLKFSDWIPLQLYKYTPQFVEDIYELYGSSMPNRKDDIKRNIYFLHKSLASKYRHPYHSLCTIKNKTEHHKYRLLMHMHIHILIARLFLSLGAMYDKRNLYDHDLDVADDLEKSFYIARTYYYRAIPYMQKAEHYAKLSGAYSFYLDLDTIETEAFKIRTKKLNYERIIERHINKIEGKLKIIKKFLDKEGRPKPVKEKTKQHIRSMYNDEFKPYPLDPP